MKIKKTRIFSCPSDLSLRSSLLFLLLLLHFSKRFFSSFYYIVSLWKLVKGHDIWITDCV